jgi:hypothetical protein
MGDSMTEYINAYYVTKQYGGPEEGGWWYNHGEPLATIEIPTGASKESIEVIKGFLKVFYENLHNPPSSNVNGYEVEIVIQDKKARKYPWTRPRYE